MGGSVGLKGTDGEMYGEALAMGAEPVSPGRTQEFLRNIASDQFLLLAAPGAMGAEHAEAAGFSCETIGSVAGTATADDTKKIATQMRAAGVDILAFAGGDGTARDVADAIGVQVPVIAIPAGVKVYSSVFAYSPHAAAELLDAFIAGAEVAEEEVLDIDEAAYREGRVESRHYGFLLVPVVDRLVQAGKESSGMSGSVADAKREIARVIVEQMDAGTLYLLGCGTTVRAVAEELGVDKALLGIDAVRDGKLVGSDLNESAILELLDSHDRATIIVTPLGGNGFIFGRGNKPFTPEVLRRVGRDNIVIIANRDKLLGLPALHVDTGDAAVDSELSGYMDVIVGQSHRKVMRVE